MAEKAYITPNVFKWARESARISEETAASKVSVSLERFKGWEAGSSQPTIKQAQTLAKSYFTQTVLDAFHGGVIEPTQASNLLNVRINKFQKLEAQLY